ncbi:MAG TPA: GGDEF domain-containing protein [Mycobacteriales bacterium]|nr:GGDEF domain-containing protein [Mycobacteriales bacterium]
MLLRPVSAVRRWALWRLPRRAVAYLVAVTALAVLLVPVLAWAWIGERGFRASDAWGLLELGACAVVSIEGARRVGLPAVVRGRPVKDLLSAWVLAIALVLPAACVALAAGVLVPLLVRGEGGLRRYRQAFNAATFALSGLAAHAAAVALLGGRALPAALPGADPLRLTVALATAAAAYGLVNTALVTAAILLAAPGTPLRDALGGAPTLVTDLTALALGVLAAVAWSVAPMLALAAVPPVVLLQRALIHDELREAAQTDAKTGLASAAYWVELARRYVDRAARDHAPCSVLLLDVDHFKLVNDTWGHLAGDRVLAAVARTVRAAVRPVDVVGRLGGEEFAVLLPETPLDAAGAVAERLRAAVAGQQVPVSGSGRDGSVGVTVSIGVAGTAEVGHAVGDLLASADGALYRAKAGGRDRIEVGGPAAHFDEGWLAADRDRATAVQWRTGVG